MRSAEEKFWSKVNKNGPVPEYDKSLKHCWVWTDYLNPKGYGKIRIKNKFISAHRYSWILHNGEIPEDKQVNHKCDNSSCVNPNHLYLGTQKDNIQDCWNRRRNAQNFPSFSFPGEKNGRAKVSNKEAKYIRDVYIPRHKKFGLEALAKKFNMSKSGISKIVNRYVRKN